MVHDPAAIILTPQELDIICGSGKFVSTHPGNKRFKLIVNKYYPDYNVAASKQDKMRVTNKVIDELLTSGSTTRFLKKDPIFERYYVGSKRAGRDKVSHCLRQMVDKKKRLVSAQHFCHLQRHRDQNTIACDKQDCGQRITVVRTTLFSKKPNEASSDFPSFSARLPGSILLPSQELALELQNCPNILPLPEALGTLLHQSLYSGPFEGISKQSKHCYHVAPTPIGLGPVRVETNSITYGMPSLKYNSQDGKTAVQQNFDLLFAAVQQGGVPLSPGDDDLNSADYTENVPACHFQPEVQQKMMHPGRKQAPTQPSVFLDCYQNDCWAKTNMQSQQVQSENNHCLVNGSVSASATQQQLGSQQPCATQYNRSASLFVSSAGGECLRTNSKNFSHVLQAPSIMETSNAASDTIKIFCWFDVINDDDASNDIDLFEQQSGFNPTNLFGPV